MNVSRVCIGGDHAGFELKSHLKGILEDLGIVVEDIGTHSDKVVDYPLYCAAVAQKVASGEADRGIVLGGSGQGEQIVANKIVGIRAALCNDVFTAMLSRRHNDANILSMGGRIVGKGLADEILRIWLWTEFDGGVHVRRLEQICDVERSGNIPL